jgi:hypothetical protein
MRSANCAKSKRRRGEPIWLKLDETASIVAELKRPCCPQPALETISHVSGADRAIGTVAVSENCARFQNIGFLLPIVVLANTRRSLALLMSADNAIPLGLHECDRDEAAKHAYREGSGEIWVSRERRGAELLGSR